MKLFYNLKYVTPKLNSTWALINFCFLLGYSKAGKLFYDMAREAYDSRGDFFPIWGTCLGFELLALFAVDGQENLKACSSQQQALPLSTLKLNNIIIKLIFFFFFFKLGGI